MRTAEAVVETTKQPKTTRNLRVRVPVARRAKSINVNRYVKAVLEEAQLVKATLNASSRAVVAQVALRPAQLAEGNRIVADTVAGALWAANTTDGESQLRAVSRDEIQERRRK